MAGLALLILRAGYSCLRFAIFLALLFSCCPHAMPVPWFQELCQLCEYFFFLCSSVPYPYIAHRPPFHSFPG